MADLHTTLVHFDILYDQPVRLSPLVQRITANNPSPFTGAGTNTYLVGTDRFTVIDPGPAEPEHIDAILAATGGKIDYVFATHAHEDHSPAALPLVQATGAQMMGLQVVSDSESLDHTFTPARSLQEGEVVSVGECDLRVIATPGHLHQHLSFLLPQEQLLFAGDHIMQGASVVIIPEHGGCMVDYLDSLMKLKGIGIQHLAPAHGHLLSDPDRVLQELHDHRLARERMIVDALRTLKKATTAQLAPLVYPDVAGDLVHGTYMALAAHLHKLVHDGVASRHWEKHWLLGEVVWELVE